jgi:ABC-2 type transport system ATP-binding protein
VGGRVDPVGPDTLMVSGLDLEQIGDSAHAADVALYELSAHAGSLEDVFIALTNPSHTTQEACAS